ncbi:MAG: hypothetical protein RRY40_06180 [Oscillospiraceae bacterium]
MLKKNLPVFSGGFFVLSELNIKKANYSKSDLKQKIENSRVKKSGIKVEK